MTAKKAPARKSAKITPPKVKPVIKNVAATEAAVVAVVERRITWNPASAWKTVKIGAMDPMKTTNRAAWMRHVASFDTDTVEAWLADLKENGLPAYPTPKAEKTVYTPGMWLGWMVRENIITLD